MKEISKEDIYTICIEQNYSRPKAAKYFGVGERVIAKYLKEYGLNKFQEIKIDKDELYEYYIVQNHSLEETEAYFKMSKTCLCSKLRKYGIKKESKNYNRVDQKVHLDKDKIIHFYIDLNYTLEETAKELGCTFKVLTRRLKEFGIKKDTKKRYELSAKTFLKNNGVSHPAQSEKHKQKMMETNKKRYGVPYACMREEYHRFKGSDSKVNLDFDKKLIDLGIEHEREFCLDNLLYDFKVGNILIELDPTATHNSSKAVYKCNPKEKNYHLHKSMTAYKHGYHCIHIFEWDDEDKIINLFLQNKEKVYARECDIREINKLEADSFLEKYHLQGAARGNIVNIGLFYNDELIELMTFGKPRYNKNYQWELLRLCSSKTVIGGSAKILSYFEKEYKPTSLLTYCDLSKFNGNVYKNLGFELLKRHPPIKHWCYLGKGKRQHITDNFLRQRGFDQLFGTSYGKGTSNAQLMLENGYVIVYDCGQATYIKLFQK